MRDAMMSGTAAGCTSEVSWSVGAKAILSQNTGLRHQLVKS